MSNSAAGMIVNALPEQRRIILSVLFLSIIAAVSLGPVLFVVVSSFNVSDISDGQRFGLAGWRHVLGDQEIWDSIINSFFLSLRVPVGIMVAFLAAWLLIRVEVPGRRFIETTFWFGFFLPSIPILTGWILLLDENFGLVNDWLQRWGLSDGPVFTIHSATGIMWVHLSMNTVPIIVILLAPAFRQFDSALEEAAIVSGAGPYTTFRKIILPLLGPAILVAGTASFIKSLETFEIEQILGVPAGIDVYSTKIYALVNWDPPLFPQAMALSSVFLIILVALAVLHRGFFVQKAARPTYTGRDSFRRSQHRTWIRWCGSIALFAYVIFSIILPFVILIVGSFMRLFGFFDLPDPWTTDHWTAVLTNPNFSRAAISSILLGLAAGVPGAILFAGVSWVLVRSDLYGRSFASFLVWLPWAIPGLVLGVALLDLTLNVPVISIFHGTLLPVMLALLIKELPIGVQMMRVSLGQMPRGMEEAGLVAGAGRTAIFFRITLPLLSPALLAVFLVIFSAAVRDISTIVLIAPPDLQTLSLLMFSYASISNFESAAVVGTIVALISLGLAITAHWLGTRAGIVR